MRIALLTAEYPPDPGGVGDYTARLFAMLATYSDATLAVLTMRAGSLCLIEDDTIKPGCQPLHSMKDWGWGMWSALRSALQRWHPDVLHIQYQTGAYAMHPAINLLPTYLGRLGPRPRLVVTMHDLLLPYLAPRAAWLREWVTYRLMADSDALIVTNSDDLLGLQGQTQQIETKQGLALYQGRRSLPASLPVSMIPIASNIEPAPAPGYQRNLWRQRLGIGPDIVLLAYFGLISHSKGLDTILDALEQLPEQVRLLLIGGEAAAAQDQAYARQLRERIQTGPLQQRVQITGHAAPEEVSAYLLAADIAVLPFTDGASFRRGSLLAALAHGLPVITTRPRGQVAAGPQLVDGQNAVLIAPQDAEALAAAVRRLSEQPVLRLSLAEAAKDLAACFSWQDIAKQHMQLYEKLMSFEQ